MDTGDLVGFLEEGASAIRAALAALREDAAFREAGNWLAAPGMLLLGEFGLEAQEGTPYLAAALIGWGFWVRVTRLSFFTLARPFGLAGPWQYAFFLDLWLPYQKPLRKWLRLCSWVRQQRFGEGPRQYWAGFWHTVAFPFRTGGTPLGRLALGQRLGLHMTIGLPGDGDKHIACISYSGGGKTNWLKTWIGCLGRLQGAFIFDTDGTIAGQFAPALERDGHRVVKIDADRLDKRFPCSTWSMMREITAAAIRHGHAAVAGFVTNLQIALIVPDSKTQPVRLHEENPAIVLWACAAKAHRDFTCGWKDVVQGEEAFEEHPLTHEIAAPASNTYISANMSEQAFLRNGKPGMFGFVPDAFRPPSMRIRVSTGVSTSISTALSSRPLRRWSTRTSSARSRSSPRARCSTTASSSSGTR